MTVCTCWKPTDPHTDDCPVRKDEDRRLAAMWDEEPEPEVEEVDCG